MDRDALFKRLRIGRAAHGGDPKTTICIMALPTASDNDIADTNARLLSFVNQKTMDAARLTAATRILKLRKVLIPAQSNKTNSDDTVTADNTTKIMIVLEPLDELVTAINTATLEEIVKFAETVSTLPLFKADFYEHLAPHVIATCIRMCCASSDDVIKRQIVMLPQTFLNVSFSSYGLCHSMAIKINDRSSQDFKTLQENKPAATAVTAIHTIANSMRIQYHVVDCVNNEVTVTPCSVLVASVYSEMKEQPTTDTDDTMSLDGITFYATGRHVVLTDAFVACTDLLRHSVIAAWMSRNALCPVLSSVHAAFTWATYRLPVPPTAPVEMFADPSESQLALCSTPDVDLSPAAAMYIEPHLIPCKMHPAIIWNALTHVRGVLPASVRYLELAVRRGLGIEMPSVYLATRALVGLIEHWCEVLEVGTARIKTGPQRACFGALIVACTLRDLSNAKETGYRMASTHDAAVQRCLRDVQRAIAF